MNIKPVDRYFGFLTLMVLGFIMSITDEPVAACVCIGCGLIFDAVKTK